MDLNVSPFDTYYSLEDVGEWSFEAASKMISRIAANNWFVPRGIDVKTYQPA